MDYSMHIAGTDFAVSYPVSTPAVYNVLVDVIRITKTNTAGGPTEAEAVLHASMMCAIKWKSGGEKILFNKETHYLDAVMRCRKVDITTKDRIRYNAQDYEIADLYDFNNLGTLLVIALKRIDND